MLRRAKCYLQLPYVWKRTHIKLGGIKLVQQQDLIITKKECRCVRSDGEVSQVRAGELRRGRRKRGGGERKARTQGLDWRDWNSPAHQRLMIRHLYTHTHTNLYCILLYWVVFCVCVCDLLHRLSICVFWRGFPPRLRAVASNRWSLSSPLDFNYFKALTPPRVTT